MPPKGSHWTDEHRAAFAASVERRRAANPPEPRRRKPTASGRFNDVERHLARLDDRVAELDHRRILHQRDVGELYGKLNRLERPVNDPRFDQLKRDLIELLAVERRHTAQLERELTALQERVGRLEQRPEPKVVLLDRPDHRRLADGGTHPKDQGYRPRRKKKIQPPEPSLTALRQRRYREKKEGTPA